MLRDEEPGQDILQGSWSGHSGFLRGQAEADPNLQSHLAGRHRQGFCHITASAPSLAFLCLGDPDAGSQGQRHGQEVGVRLQSGGSAGPASQVVQAGG